MATLLSLFVIPGEAVSSFRENLLSFWRHGVYATNQQPLVCAIHAPRKRARQAAALQFSNLLKTKSLQNWIPPSPTTSDCDSVAIYLKRPPGESKVLESVIHPTSPRAKQFRQEKLRNGNRGGAQRTGECSLLIHVIQLDLNVRRREDVIGMRRGSKHFLSLLQALSVLYLHDVLSQVSTVECRK